MLWVAYSLLAVAQLVGIFLTLVGLPGIWVMVAAAAGYGWYTGWDYVGVYTLITLSVLAIIAEILEFVAGSAGARKAGGSKRAAWGALIGGIAGALLLTIPLPIIGTTIGLCIGVFIGALVFEFTVHSDTDKSIKVGIGAAIGRLVGILIKLVFGLAIMAIALLKAVPFGSAAPALGPTTTQTQTQPAQ